MKNITHFDQLSNYEKTKALEALTNYFWIKRGLVVSLVLILVMMGIGPPYNVWQQGLEGKAELRRAEQNRQIAINEAMALSESANYRAEAEIKRAYGIDEANKIIAESLGGPEGYLRYLYIDALQATNCETIYVPTEAGLPITEAVRFNKVAQ